MPMCKSVGHILRAATVEPTIALHGLKRALHASDQRGVHRINRHEIFQERDGRVGRHRDDFSGSTNRSTIYGDMSLDLAREIAAAVRDAGGRAPIVGGWVRDRLRGHPSKDLDLEVFGRRTIEEAARRRDDPQRRAQHHASTSPSSH
jgi:hypothetical protein